MNRTKKGLLTISSILTIIASSAMCLFGGFMFFCAQFSNEQILIDSYLEDEEINAELIELENDNYIIIYTEDGKEYELTKKEIVSLSHVIKNMLYIMGGLIIAGAIAKFVLAVLILKNSTNNEVKNGQVVALLVLNLMSSSVIESVLLIIALYIKDKKPTLENIEEFVEN